MKKDECEAAIRQLLSKWKREEEFNTPNNELSFNYFINWLENKGYGHYLNFRSVMGSVNDAELWFDEEFGQTWKR